MMDVNDVNYQSDYANDNITGGRSEQDGNSGMNP